jgi:tRNA pseudouridine(38-40) synthase
MRTLKLTVAYDGTNYHGFQKQTNALTVQQVLEEKLSLLCGEKIVTAGSGRTDTGVHARGQVVSLTTSGSIPLENLLKACAGILPKDIVLWQAEEADEGFHARYSACWKRYCYRIVQNKHADPFLRNYVWQMREYLRLEASCFWEHMIFRFSVRPAVCKVRLLKRFTALNGCQKSRENWNSALKVMDFYIIWCVISSGIW